VILIRRKHRRRTTITPRTIRRVRNWCRNPCLLDQGKLSSRPPLRNCSSASASSCTRNALV